MNGEVFAKSPLVTNRKEKNVCDTLEHGNTNFYRAVHYTYL